MEIEYSVGVQRTPIIRGTFRTLQRPVLALDCTSRLIEMRDRKEGLPHRVSVFNP